MIEIVSLIPLLVCFFGLFLGSITDLKTREVPDYVNFTIIALGFGISLIATLVFLDVHYILASLLGFTFCFLFACIMFYTGQWGGGDAKMLMAVGALLGISWQELNSLFSISFLSSLHSPLSVSFLKQFPFLLVFLVLVFLVGGIYGLFWLGYLVFSNWQLFCQRYIAVLADSRNKTVRHWLFAAVLIVFIFVYFVSDNFLQLLLILVSFLLVFLYYSYLLIKVVEEIAMIKDIPVSAVTEGDWIAADIVIEGKTIASHKDLGISEEQLLQLRALAKQGKIKKVKVKYGIPFVPSFLIAFAVAVWFFYVL